MNDNKKEHKIQLKNILLDEIVNHSYQGKIPPERVLAELLGVNRFTLRECLDELIAEGKLYRKPRKGTYILQLHTKVVGLVVDMGKTHPYGNMMSVISGVCRELEKANYMLRFINPRDMEMLSELIRQYDLDACILGYSDHPDVKNILSFIPEEIHHKLIFVSSWAYWMKKQGVNRNYVEMAPIGAARVERIARNGGEKLCIITRKENPSLFDIKAKLEALKLPFHNEFVLDDKKSFKAKISKLSSKSGKLTVKYKKVSKNRKGYEIQIATEKFFLNPTTKTSTKTKVTFKKLTKGKTYYVRVRAYNKVDGKKVYGEWSAVKSITVK